MENQIFGQMSFPRFLFLSETEFDQDLLAAAPGTSRRIVLVF